MVQGGGGLGLAQEALTGVEDAGGRRARGRGAPEGARGQKAVGDELEGDFTFEPDVERAIDLARAACAYLLNRSVGPKESARNGHSRPRIHVPLRGICSWLLPECTQGRRAARDFGTRPCQSHGSRT